MSKLNGQEIAALGLSPAALPQHVGIIMDGNGRWATKRGFPRSIGHRAGVDRLRGIIQLSSDLGITALSLYAFSTENWKRPKEEIGVLCSLLVEYFNKEIDELHANGVCIGVLGEYAAFPKAVVDAIDKAIARTKNNGGLKLSIALNYGSRTELVRAVKDIATAVQQGKLSPEDVDEAAILTRLYTGGLPEPDLIIRTSGEQRLSNFMMVQAAYAELMFVDDFWPDFSDERYIACLKAFAFRKRRFGGL